MDDQLSKEQEAFIRAFTRQPISVGQWMLVVFIVALMALLTLVAFSPSVSLN